MVSSARHKNYAALLYIDLDHFKVVNDTLGHDAGDQLLQQVAQRLTSCLREGDSVGRLGGDEFAVILEDLSQDATDASAETKVIGEKILVLLAMPYQLNTNLHSTTLSIGATFFVDYSGTIEELLKRADVAMYSAKAAGRNRLRFFDQ